MSDVQAELEQLSQEFDEVLPPEPGQMTPDLRESIFPMASAESKMAAAFGGPEEANSSSMGPTEGRMAARPKDTGERTQTNQARQASDKRGAESLATTSSSTRKRAMQTV